MNSSISDAAGMSQEKPIELLQLFRNLTEALRLMGFHRGSLQHSTIGNILLKNGTKSVCPLFGHYFYNSTFLIKTPTTNPLDMSEIM